MTYPRISVITPCLNQVAFVESTLESIHGQGYPNLEHIVIDGGSTDGSAEIIEKYSDRLAYWVSEPDEGQTHALIRGFERATGDIQCWLNSDDVFEPETLTSVARVFESRSEVEFAYGDSTWVDLQGRVIKEKREHRWSRFVMLYDHNYIPQPSSFWRADLYRSAGGLDAGFDIAMDADLFLRFAERTRPRHFRQKWSRMRFYPEQKNTRLRSKGLAEMQSLRDRYVRGSRIGDAGRSALARGLRIALKAIDGGYSPSEVAVHMKSLRDGRSWESREVVEDDPSELL